MSTTPHLKLHRENAKKTQSDIARILSEITGQTVNQSQVSRWEDDPDSIPARMMRPLTQALGINLDDLFEAPLGQDAMRVDPGAPYAALRRNTERLRSYLEAAPKGAPPPGMPAPEQVQELCRRIGRKPNVVMSGHFDAGKSRLCNALLGETALPARYRPTTAASTWIRHVEDRPPGLTEAVYIYRSGVDPDRFDDREHCEAHQVLSGDLDILSTHAVHKEGRVHSGDHVAVVYLDAPILRACNLVDLPGHQHNEQDARIAEEGISRADVLVYLSRAQGFLDGEDLTHLRAHLRQLPVLDPEGSDPLSNLIVVASHAHPNVSDREVADILDGGAATLARELSETVFAERARLSGVPITQAHVRARLFAFWFERADRRDPLKEGIRVTLGQRIPGAWLARIEAEVNAFRAHSRAECERHVEQWTIALRDLDRAREQHKAVRSAQSEQKGKRRSSRDRVLRAVEEEGAGALAYLDAQYASLVTEAAVEQLVKRRYPKKEDAQKHAAGAVVDLLQSRVAADGESRARRLVPLVEGYLGGFDLPAVDRPGDAPVLDIAFDARGTFLGGMAGLGAIGALGVWAGTLGNLGGYIIVAKVAGLLAALGIGVGGSAALVSLVAALGGPAVVGVALAVAIGWIFSALFGETWERRLAKKVVKTLQDARVKERFATGVRKFWSDTRTAFVQAADKVEADFAERLETLGNALEGPAVSQEEVARLHASATRIRDFYAGLPWRAPEG